MTANTETRLLERVNCPSDLKNLDIEQLNSLANEIREYLVSVVSKTGGHLSANLGVVELTLALHRCFDFSKDRLIFDVGHQSYTHKLLTPRDVHFESLRQHRGISGFPKTGESIYDAFNVGHSSTSISAAIGMARANRILGKQDVNVVALIGDGALTGGIAYEALNDAGADSLPLIVILNDNNMSIGGSVGGVSSHLTHIRTSKGYKRFKKHLSARLKKIPFIGNTLSSALERLKNRIKFFLLPNVMFEELGFTYMGPANGHDIEELIDMIEHAKNIKDKPILLHVMTKKGKGYAPAEANPEKFHGVGKFDIESGEIKSSNNNSKIFSSELCSLAASNDKIVAITAAMTEGTGLTQFKEKFPDRFFDVGIAEQHAVTMAAGMAAAGVKPVFVVYSTFLQRGYDQLLHDVCLQNLPVVFGIDRAGLVGADGETHQGVYDIAYLNTLPRGLKLFSPSSVEELRAMLDYAVTLDCPTAIRYNRGLLPSRPLNRQIPLDKWELLSDGIKPLTVIATGRFVGRLEDIIRNNVDFCDNKVGLINARLLCPIDSQLIAGLESAKIIITVEDGCKEVGFGTQIAGILSSGNASPKVIRLGIPQVPIEAASIDEQDDFCDLSKEKLTEIISNFLKEIS